MRGISGWIVSVGVGVFLTSGWASAQDAVKPAVQVIIGADGSVKVIDPSTGKEINSVVTKVQTAPKADQQRLQAHGQLELARMQLERVLRAQHLEVAPPQGAKKDKKDPKPIEIELQLDFGLPQGGKKDKKEAKPIEIEFHIIPGPDGKLRFIQAPKAKPAADTLEKKIDLLLRQMEELRRDVNQLKNKIEGKKPEVRLWQIIPQEGKDKKPEPPRFLLKPTPSKGELELYKEAIEKNMEELLKKLKAESRDKAKRAAEKERPPVDRNAELEQRIERILREAEELRREISKKKTPAK
jgi:hypothetical protein